MMVYEICNVRIPEWFSKITRQGNIYRKPLTRIISWRQYRKCIDYLERHFFVAFMIKEKERRIYQSWKWDVVFKKGFLTQCGNNGNYERKRLQPAQSILKASATDRS